MGRWDGCCSCAVDGTHDEPCAACEWEREPVTKPDAVLTIAEVAAMYSEQWQSQRQELGLDAVDELAASRREALDKEAA